ncbi:MAG: helix-turn-helix domain-containing protein [Acidobacteriia bacterium]|nr:helix-turn-helix domain-containing protein [Terriglobia bacterium]
MLSQAFEEIVDRLATLIAVRVQSRIGPPTGRGGTVARLLTVKEAAAYVGRTEQAVQHLIHKRELIVVRRGRRVHLDRADLDRWIDANKV